MMNMTSMMLSEVDVDDVGGVKDVGDVVWMK